MAAPGHRRRTVLLAATALAALATTASAAPARAAQVPPRETVAGIDPALVTGRGAQLGIVEQEAENAVTNGTILPFDTSAYTLAGEASGRQAVRLSRPVRMLRSRSRARRTRSRSGTRSPTLPPAAGSTPR
jgi:hypothetical protein